MLVLWALLVAVEDYYDEEWPSVWGASLDLDVVRGYLEKDLAVPSSHIVTLHNTQATRENILSSFQSHLIANDRIERGDALLFYFTGHGSRSRAPNHWPVIDDPDTPEDDLHMLEVILPVDINQVDSDTGRPICGIPDRTVGILLARAAKAHGNNITVVLDCCNSGHGTRSSASTSLASLPYSIRGVHHSLVSPLWNELDQDILAQTDSADPANDATHVMVRGGFTELRVRSHVLLAACGKLGGSLGTPEGGLFTRYWISSLRRPDIYPRSYSNMIGYIANDIRDHCKREEWPPEVTQYPQCEGVTRDRIVFENTQADPRHYPVTVLKEAPQEVVIQAGEIHGVQPGTSFEIYACDGLATRAIGTAVATEVFSTSCKADIPIRVSSSRTQLKASIIQLASYRLKFAIKNANLSKRVQEHRLTIDKEIQGTSAKLLSYAEEVEEASSDLIIEVGDDRVVFNRQDVYLKHVGTPHPSINFEDLEYAHLPSILASIHHFNFYFAQTNPNHPFQDGRVTFEMFLLEPDPDLSYLDISLEKPLALKKRIPFVNNDAIIMDNGEDDNYAFIIRNDTQASLYPYLVYFDPRTYQIQTWFTALDCNLATLLPHSTLQIGSSPEHAAPFTFTVSGDGDTDVCFVKVILSDYPVDTEFINQDPIWGKTSSWDRLDNEQVELNTPSWGVWDTIMYRITIRRG